MKSSYLIAAGIAVLSTAWLVSGAYSSDPSMNEPVTQESHEKKLIQVRVMDSSVVPLTSKIITTGRTQAVRTATLSAEIDGQIESILKEEGDYVEKNDIIAEIEVNDLKSRLKEAQKRLSQRQIEYKAAKSLQNKGFNSKVKLASASADLETAQTNLNKAQIDYENTKIKAPFSGILNTQSIEIGDHVSNGTSLFTLSDLDTIEFTGYVSEHDVLKLQKGADVTIRRLDGSTKQAKLTYIAPSADELTRSFRIIASAENEDKSFLDGLTVRITIPTHTSPAHKISPSILALDGEGEVGVKIVTAENKVEFRAVEILQDSPDHMWIGGLPDQAKIITVGQEFVITGQTVEPVMGKIN